MKLAGLRVLDLSLFLPGPYLSMLMADHGAEVIKIEPPGDGEPVRLIGARQAGHSVWFRNTHRGKRSLSVDLKTAQGREILLKLAATADVLIEGFRPGTVARLGIDYAAVAARNPKIVYCAISAFGQTGPKRDKPAHDLAIQADSGLVSLNLGRDGLPTHPNMPVADLAGSLTALAGVLMALYRREQTGQGDYIDLSMQDAALSFTPNVIGAVFAEQRAPEVKQQRSFGGGSFYALYQTRDGRWLALGGSEPKFARSLLSALGRADLIPAAVQPPGPGHEPVKAFLSQCFAERPLAQWTEFLDAIDVCWAPVRDLHAAITEPHLAARGSIVRDAHGALNLANPIRFASEPCNPSYDLPEIGEHNAEVLRGLGYSDAQIDALRRDGVIQQGAAADA